MTLSQAVEAFLRTKANAETRKAYQWTLGGFADYVGPDREVTDITQEDSSHFIEALARRDHRFTTHPTRPEMEGGLSLATITNYTKQLRAFFNWAVREEIIRKSPARSLPVYRSRKLSDSKAMPAEDLASILAYASRKAHSLSGARNFALLMFLADTGCRRTGAASLTVDNLHLAEQWALLTEKGGMQTRVYFGEETGEALTHWLSKRPNAAHPFVFTTVAPPYEPLTKTAIATRVRYIAKKATGKSYGPHAIRHRVGQAWADAGISPTLVAQKLGHRSVQTTLQHYFNQDTKRLKAASDKLALAAVCVRSKRAKIAPARKLKCTPVTPA